MENLSKVKVYDNGGESFDRYTVFLPDGSVYGMSENAEGFNLYIGDTEPEGNIRPGDHLGVLLPNVPEGIVWAVIQRMKQE